MEEVLEELQGLVKPDATPLSLETVLIGDRGVLDSMGLVELCLRLEDRAANIGFSFDWTSDSAMSQTRSMFQSVASLQDEFSRQGAREK